MAKKSKKRVKRAPDNWQLIAGQFREVNERLKNTVAEMGEDRRFLQDELVVTRGHHNSLLKLHETKVKELKVSQTKVAELTNRVAVLEFSLRAVQDQLRFAKAEALKTIARYRQAAAVITIPYLTNRSLAEFLEDIYFVAREAGYAPEKFEPVWAVIVRKAHRILDRHFIFPKEDSHLKNFVSKES